MSAHPENPYLASEVLTATPQKRHLLLLEAASRFARQGRDLYRQKRTVEARRSIARSQNIVAEMACALDPGPAVDLVRKVAGLYRFILDGLAAAALADDERRLDESLRLLEHECETWRQLCARLSAVHVPASAST